MDVHTNVGAATLENKSAIVTKDPVKILFSPQPWCAHRLDQVGACKQRNVDLSFLAVSRFDSAHDVVQLVIKVIQDLDGREVFFVQRLPRVDANPG